MLVFGALYAPRLIPPCVSSLGVDKLWPMGQSWPVACFCTARKLRLVFTFFNCWKKSQKRKTRIISCDTRKLCAIQISVLKKKVRLKCNCAHSFTYVYSCFCATTAKLSSWGEDCMSIPHGPVFYYLVIYRKKFAILWSNLRGFKNWQAFHFFLPLTISGAMPQDSFSFLCARY